jgi:demethylmenaquinone methyltransferase/2-methoxy-6-polyprenyl-1,4-benzoquinol methylase
VVALDPCAGMLAESRRRGLDRLVRGVAEALPFADDSFDFLVMGYALRHVADLEATFAEYRRVLRPGGRLLVLEITPPRGRFSFGLLRAYLGRVVPWLAARYGAAPAELMRYYWDTIERCVAPATILGALAASGFDEADRRVELGIFSAYGAVAR